MAKPPPAVATVTPNPAFDHTVFVPGFAIGSVNRVGGERRDVGGKGVNVAAALAHDGVACTVTGFLGRDSAVPFEAFFAARGLTDAFVRVPGTTRANLKLIDETGGTVTDVNFPGITPRDDDIAALEDTVARLSAAHDWVVLAGSLPPGAPEDLHARLVAIAKSAGARVALDTSGSALRHGLEAGPDLVKPNREELSAALGRTLDDDEQVADAVTALTKRGVGAVIVSLGSSGAIAGMGGDIIQVRPPPVRPVSTVGAGDSLLAGYLSARLAGATFAEAVARGVARGSWSVTVLGSPAPPAGVIEAMAERVDRIRPETSGQENGR